jgi:hypothetical protein
LVPLRCGYVVYPKCTSHTTHFSRIMTVSHRRQLGGARLHISRYGGGGNRNGRGGRGETELGHAEVTSLLGQAARALRTEVSQCTTRGTFLPRHTLGAAPLSLSGGRKVHRNVSVIPAIRIRGMRRRERPGPRPAGPRGAERGRAVGVRRGGGCGSGGTGPRGGTPPLLVASPEACIEFLALDNRLVHGMDSVFKDKRILELIQKPIPQLVLLRALIPLKVAHNATELCEVTRRQRFRCCQSPRGDELGSPWLPFGILLPLISFLHQRFCFMGGEHLGTIHSGALDFQSILTLVFNHRLEVFEA